MFMTLTSENCNPEQKSNISDVKQATSKFEIPKDADGYTIEQTRIFKRIKVTSDPTKILWIHIYALDGHIIFRNPVQGKVTSSGKRLEPITAASGTGTGSLPQVRPDQKGDYLLYTSELMQADGTFGSSDPYIFWFDPMDRYHQKGEGYLLTDYPIDLDNPVDKITGLYNAQIAALKWQHEQEEILKKNLNK